MKLPTKLTKRWITAALLAGAAVVALLGPEFSGRLRGLTGCVLAPFGDGGMYLATAIKSRANDMGRRGLSPAEARRLREINEQLLGRLHAAEGQLDRLLRRQETLRRLYNSIPYAQWELIPAQVVGADALGYGQMRVLNAGQAQGAAAGARVTTRRLLTDRSKALPSRLATISATALVGEVIDAGRFTAQLRLITDQGFQVRAEVRRIIKANKPRTITVIQGDAAEQVLTKANNAKIPVQAAGDGRGHLIARDVNAYHNILPGDWVVTLADSEFLPAEIPIGKVIEVIDDPKRRGLFVSLRIKPVANLPALREVYIVVPAGLSPSDKETVR